MYIVVLSTDGGDGHLFAVVRETADRRHRACVLFTPRTPEVVQLRHVTAPADTPCHADVFDNSNDFWLLVDVVAFQQPFPVLQHRPCVLRGGFQMRVSGVGTANDGPLDFRKCGSFVEMRIESDCSADLGVHFDFRLDVCVPEGLFMYARQRTLCVGNWTSGPYTFMLLRHDSLPYLWIFRFQTALEDSFVAYLWFDLVDDVSDIPSVTSRYFRFDMVRSSAVPVTSLCVDESEICATVDDEVSRRCKTGNGNKTFGAVSPLTCPRACGLCNATRPTLCEFLPEMVGHWHNGVNFTDAEFQLMTAVNRKSIDVVMATRDAAAIQERFYCIQWETKPTPRGKQPTHSNRFIFDEFLLVNEPRGGCRKRYACAWVLLKSESVIYFRLSGTRTWPFTSTASEPVDCSSFESDARFHVLISQDRRDLVTCHLPGSQLANYSVTFSDDVSCDAMVAVEPEVRHRLRLTMSDCTSPSPVWFDCLDSMLATPTGDVILVTVVATLSTSGVTRLSPTGRTNSPAYGVTKLVNVSLYLSSNGKRPTLAPTQFTTSTSSSFSSSSVHFQPGAVHCWLFARSSFPHVFHFFAGSQCDHVVVTSEAGLKTPAATFVKKRLRWPRLFAADQPVLPTLSQLKTQNTSDNTRDSRLLTAQSRDTEHCV